VIEYEEEHVHMSRRIAAVAVATALLLGQGSTVGAGEPAGDIPVGIDPAGFSALLDNTSPVAVEGQLLSTGGSGTEGRVEALAWPTAKLLASLPVGVPFYTPPVGAAVTNTDGSFRIRLSADSVPRDYIDEDGQVDLELIAWDGEHQRSWFVSIQSRVADGELLWVSPTTGDDLTASAARGPVTAAITLSEPLTNGGSLAKPTCVEVLRATYNVWSQLGDGLVYNFTQYNWMSHSSSHSMTVGVATSSSGSSWSASGSTGTTTGVTFTWAERNSDRYFDVQVQYGKFETFCQGVSTGFTFKARFPTGGYRERLVSYNPSWTNCAPVSAGTWSRTSSSGNHFALGFGVDASPYIGIDLSLDTNYGSTRTLYIRQTVSRHVCGSNNVPSLAGRIEGEA
jgi:hypothetical protein